MVQAALVKQIQDAESDLRVNCDARVKELTKVRNNRSNPQPQPHNKNHARSW